MTEVTQKIHIGVDNKIQVHLTLKSGNKQDELGGEFLGWKGAGPPQDGLGDEV